MRKALKRAIRPLPGVLVTRGRGSRDDRPRQTPMFGGDPLQKLVTRLVTRPRRNDRKRADIGWNTEIPESRKIDVTP